MKLFKVRLQESAKSCGLTLLVIERDYIQSYILAGIAARPALRDTPIFKGGTALKKIHFKEYRFSEDLDFSAVAAPTGPALEAELRDAVGIARQMVREHAEIELSMERYVQRDEHPGGQEAFVVRVKYPWHPRALVNIKLEITHDEPVFLARQVLQVTHGYDEPSKQRFLRTHSKRSGLRNFERPGRHSRNWRGGMGSKPRTRLLRPVAPDPIAG